MKKFYLKRDDTLLIIVDLQERLMAAMPQRDRVFRNTAVLLALAGQYQLPVIVTEQYPRGLGPTVTEIKQALPEHVCLEKVRFSASSRELSEILTKLGRPNIIMTGSETHVCVFQTTRDLLEAGYNIHLVRDAVCSRFEENYLNGLALMQDMGAVVTTTETVVFDLLEEAGSPEFRAMSALIK
ncbi:MAG TPA: isochorismatase family protein [Syntrophomonadaceae bacterium]|nr:isochorismatase family protein [Syntrophomonadaceae bacterium]